MNLCLKYFFAFIVGIYLINNIGLPVYYHYCGGELESVNTLFKTGGCCGEMEEDEDSDCCKNETKIISQKSESDLNTFQFKVVSPVSNLFYYNPSCNPSSNHTGLLQLFNSFDLTFLPPKNGRSILTSKSVLII